MAEGQKDHVEGWDDAEPVAAVAKPVRVVSPSRRAEVMIEKRGPVRNEAAAIERVREIEDRLFDRHSRVLEDVALFREIDPGQKEPPEEWVKEYGKREAERMFRLAQAAWLPKKAAPAGIDVSRAVVASMIKSKSEKASGDTFNIGIFMPPPEVDRTVEDEPYPIVEVDGDDL